MRVLVAETYENENDVHFQENFDMIPTIHIIKKKKE